MDNVRKGRAEEREAMQKAFHEVFSFDLLEKGDYVKIRVVTGLNTSGKEVREYMWIKITSLDAEKQEVTGTLNNTPVFPNSVVKHGNPFTVKYSDVYNHLDADYGE